MNILWLSHLLPFPPIGGVQQRSFHLIQRAAQYNQVDLIAFNQRAIISDIDGVAFAKKEFMKFCHNTTVLDIPCELLPYGKQLLALKSLFTIDSYNINWLKSLLMHSEVEKTLSQNHYDIVWFDTISLVPYLKYVRKSKTILDHHNIESDMMIRRARMVNNPLLKSYFFLEGIKLRAAEKRFCPRFDLNVTCSSLDSQRLRDKLPNVNSAEIPNGVDIKYFKPSGKKSKKHSLIFAGTLSWYPNSEAMVYFVEKIWPLLINEFPDIEMTVVGKDPPEVLKNLCATDKRFKVTGFVDDVRPFIEEAAVYVCPIMNGGGTKLKILDALAMGKAIVAHKVACEGIEVEDGKNVLFAETPQMYLQKIRYLFENDDIRISLETAGRMLAEKVYSYEQIGSDMQEKFKNVISEK